MIELINKISSYNLFNYFFPGAIFFNLLTYIGIINDPTNDIVAKIIIYYFTGLSISRFGSVLIEPILRHIKFLDQKEDYNTYLMAHNIDAKMETMLEVSNTYRTLLAGFIILIFGVTIRALSDSLEISSYWRNLSLLFTLATLFLFSFRKQDIIVTNRIRHYSSI